jgi:hypothetical protein
MGFFDAISELLEAAVPWTSVEAEAAQGEGAGEEKTSSDKGGKEESEVCIVLFWLCSLCGLNWLIEWLLLVAEEPRMRSPLMSMKNGRMNLRFAG